MSRMTKKKEGVEESQPIITRAHKREATKELIKEILKAGGAKASEIIENAARLYAERYAGQDTENPNDVKGRVGSVLDIMKKEGEVVFEGGVYAMKLEKTQPTATEKVEEKPIKKTTKRTAKKTENTSDEQGKTEENPVKVKRTRAKKKTDEKTEEKEPQETVLPLPPAPLQPNAPVVPTTPEIAPEPIPPEKTTPKKRGRKAKTEKVTVENKAEKTVMEAEVKAEPALPLIVEEKEIVKSAKPAEEISSPKGTLMDMSFLFGEIKPLKKQEKPVTPAPKAEDKSTEKPAEKTEEKSIQKSERTQRAETKKVEVKRQEKRAQGGKRQSSQSQNARRVEKAQTTDEKLQAAFLSKLHKLGGEYFEYYSIYLLEKYSRQNGRRLEGLKITAGDHDGGIDGEIELTDKLGFRETIYIQAKNWDPSKGDERLWVVGETLLQQFIGACVCRQAKEGKQHCRGIFITTSRFTPEAKKILDDTSDKFLGYDGTDLYETAKECRFGLVEKDGEWTLDEELLSGTKAFFNMN